MRSLEQVIGPERGQTFGWLEIAYHKNCQPIRELPDLLGLSGAINLRRQIDPAPRSVFIGGIPTMPPKVCNCDRYERALAT